MCKTASKKLNSPHEKAKITSTPSKKNLTKSLAILLKDTRSGPRYGLTEKMYIIRRQLQWDTRGNIKPAWWGKCECRIVNGTSQTLHVYNVFQLNMKDRKQIHLLAPLCNETCLWKNIVGTKTLTFKTGFSLAQKFTCGL